MLMRKCLLLFLTLFVAAATCLARTTKDKTVLITVNGVDIRRAEAVDRAWKQYGTAVINDMADEILIRQAADALKLKPDAKEVDARLKRIQGQFSDEATFQKRLTETGTTLAALRAQIEQQVLREHLVIQARGLQATETEAKEFFDANKDKLGASEAVRLRNILVASEKEANDFLVAVRAGADFAKLAAQISLDNATKGRFGDLGFISRGMLQPDIEKAVFNLKAGEVSAPIKTAEGYHIFKLEGTRPAKAPVYAEIKGDIMQAVLADKISKTWPGYIKELRDKAKYENVAR